MVIAHWLFNYHLLPLQLLEIVVSFNRSALRIEHHLLRLIIPHALCLGILHRMCRVFTQKLENVFLLLPLFVEFSIVDGRLLLFYSLVHS